MPERLTKRKRMIRGLFPRYLPRTAVLLNELRHGVYISEKAKPTLPSRDFVRSFNRTVYRSETIHAYLADRNLLTAGAVATYLIGAAMERRLLTRAFPPDSFSVYICSYFGAVVVNVTAGTSCVVGGMRYSPSDIVAVTLESKPSKPVWAEFDTVPWKIYSEGANRLDPKARWEEFKHGPTWSRRGCYIGNLDGVYFGTN